MQQRIAKETLLERLTQWAESARKQGIATEEIQKIEELSASSRFWTIANQLGDWANRKNDPLFFTESMEVVASIRDYQGQKAYHASNPTTVVFGTSGWRGVIGEDFHILNVHKVIRAIVEMMRQPVFLRTNGYSSFTEVQKAGLLLFRDNRFMGDDFCRVARMELNAARIKVYEPGMCPTGVGSALVTQFQTAGSINFTPS
ncbi:MAG: hypothetical protein F6K07_33140, partial [Okeania sp. SIO1H5]|nr:hypothetical protein [Okeania sp. SIO1H5]